MDITTALILGAFFVPLVIVLIQDRKVPRSFIGAGVALLLGLYIGRWLATPAELEALRNAILAIVGLGTVFIGYSGLQTWNRQLRGTNQYQLACRLMTATYGAQNAVTTYRTLFMTHQDPHHSQRWAEMISALPAFRSAVFESLAVWNADEIRAGRDDIEGVVWFLGLDEDGFNDVLVEIDQGKLKSPVRGLAEHHIHSIFSCMPNDEIQKQLDEGVEKIRSFCDRIVRA